MATWHFIIITTKWRESRLTCWPNSFRKSCTTTSHYNSQSEIQKSIQDLFPWQIFRMNSIEGGWNLKGYLIIVTWISTRIFQKNTSAAELSHTVLQNDKLGFCYLIGTSLDKLKSLDAVKLQSSNKTFYVSFF